MRLRQAALGIASLAALVAAGCAQLQHQLEPQFIFQESQRRYTQLVRWAEFDRAGGFVAEEARAEFLAKAAELGRVRFTDYKLRETTFSDDGDEVTVRVTYYVYLRTQPIAIALDEEQQWKRENDAWMVRPTFTQRPLQAGEEFF